MASERAYEATADAHSEDDMLDADEAAEEIDADDEDHPMDEDDEGDAEAELELANDSLAHFDKHTDSLFAIAAHPLDPHTIATGSGDDSTYVFSTAGVPVPTPRVLPASYEANPARPAAAAGPRDSLPEIAHLTGHSDSISALAFSLPDGAYLLTAGLDGKLRMHDTRQNYALVGEAQEVEEIAWLAACPHPERHNVFAFGANDGSVWVYMIETSPEVHLSIINTYYQHTAASTAGAWSPQGSLLASVADDSSLFVYDPFGDAAAAGVKSATGQAIVALTAEDQRFHVDGGLYSVAIAPSGAFLAVGGYGGTIRIVGLPLLSNNAASSGSKSGSGSRQKAGGAKQAAAPGGAVGGQPGVILASLQAQTDSVETLAFAPQPLTLLAAGSVDGSIALFDCAHRFAIRRMIRGAHGEDAVVQVKWNAAAGARVSASTAATAPDAAWMLTSAGMDGVLRRWDARGGTAAANMGLVQEWRGHRGGGEGGGVLGFVQSTGLIVSAGDDGVALVFDAQ